MRNRNSRSAAARHLLPQAEWLVAVAFKAVEACRAALRAHQDAEGANCDCGLHTDLHGQLFNLTCAATIIECQLPVSARECLAVLGPAVDRQTRLEPVVNTPEADRLLRVLDLYVAACDALDEAHDAANPSGRCCCELCCDVEGIRYNVRTARELIGGQLRSLDAPAKMLATLTDIRASSREHDGAGCACGICTMDDEAMRAVANRLGVKARPVEDEADTEADAPFMTMVATSAE